MFSVPQNSVLLFNFSCIYNRFNYIFLFLPSARTLPNHTRPKSGGGGITQCSIAFSFNMWYHMLGCMTVKGSHMGKIQSKPLGYLEGCHSAIDSSLHCSPAHWIHWWHHRIFERNRYHSPAKWQCNTEAICVNLIFKACDTKSAKYTKLTLWKKLSFMRSGNSWWWHWRKPLQGWAIDKCSWTGLARFITWTM